MAFTPKTPSANDRSLSTISIVKTKDPYFEDFYNDEKLDGESREDFILRHMMILVNKHAIKKEKESYVENYKTEKANAISGLDFIKD